MTTQFVHSPSFNVLTRIKSSLSELNGIFASLVSEVTMNGNAFIAETCSPPSPPPTRSPNSWSYNKDRVAYLLESLKYYFEMVYSRGSQLNRRPSGFVLKLRPLYVKGKNRLRALVHRPGSPSTDGCMDGSEGERISLERNGTSWVWSALDHESEWACSIDDYNMKDEIEDEHIEFEIQTVMSNALYCRCLQSIAPDQFSEPPAGAEDEQRITVFHRFDDFKTLSGILVDAYPYLCIPPLPPNRFSKLSEKLTLYRKRHLELWLRYFAMHPILSKAKYIHNFLLQSSGEWAPQVNGLKVPEQNILGYVKPSVAYAGRLEKHSRMEEIATKTQKLEKIMGDIKKLFTDEQKAFSEGLPTAYARCCAKLKELPSLLEEKPEVLCAQNWSEAFFKAAQIFNERALSLNSKTEHFDEINSILEEFSNMAEQLRKLAVESVTNKQKAQDRATIPKAISMEAEFHWVLKNQTGRLALELADFFEFHAKLLEDDAILCRKAVDALRVRPRCAI